MARRELMWIRDELGSWTARHSLFTLLVERITPEQFEVSIQIGDLVVAQDDAPDIQATGAMALKLVREFLEEELARLQPFLT